MNNNIINLNSGIIYDRPQPYDNEIINDTTLDIIINYLKNYLNSANPIEYSQPIVKSTRNYDAFNIPVQDFPLLKIYRLKSNYRASNLRISQIQLQYGLILPDLEFLLPRLNWIDFKISEALTYSRELINIFIQPGSKSCDYRTLINEIGTPVYSFLRFNFVINEGYNCC